MKKFIALLALVFTIGLVQAQDTEKLKFDYYPEANVYFNIKAQTYWYFDAATSKWVSAPQLPAAFPVTPASPKNTLYYDGPDIWKNNLNHVKLFGKKAPAKKPAKK